jgi:hypothetical protein
MGDGLIMGSSTLSEAHPISKGLPFVDVKRLWKEDVKSKIYDRMGWVNNWYFYRE